MNRSNAMLFPSGKGKKSPKKRKGSGKKKKEKNAPSVQELQVLEDGIVSLFLSAATQQLFKCVCDEDATEEKPFIYLKKNEVMFDMKMRAAVSDFSPLKQFIMDYPEEELLLVYDSSYKYGQNFYLCVTEEAKLRLTAPPQSEKSPTGSIKDGDLMDEERVYTYEPPVSKEWIDQGSMQELSEEVIANTRPKIRYLVSRLRSEFESPCLFEDRDADIMCSDRSLSASYVACSSYRDPSFTLERMEQDNSTQCIPEVKESFSQTDWKHPVNASVQPEARSMTSKEAEEIESSDDYCMFLKETLPRLELAIQQNLIFDVFTDDWQELGEEDSNLGTKMDSHLKEYQSFTDLKHSKDRIITFVEWHPKIKGIIAVSCCERLTSDERIESTNYQLGKASMVLIWSFTDPINPQVLLESPDEILCFKFCPTNPNYIAGGCINGQLVLWDITMHAEKLNNLRSGGSSNQKSNTMFGEEAVPDIPIVRYSAVSSIEHGHINLVTSVQWVPEHCEFNKMGSIQESESGESIQLITTSTDSYILIWDTRPPKAPTIPLDLAEDEDNVEESPLLAFKDVNAFTHLDLQWKPLFRQAMVKEEESGDFCPLSFTLTEKHLTKKQLEARELAELRRKSSKETIPLSSEFFVGCEDGEFLWCKFKLDRGQDTGKQNPQNAKWCSVAHDGPVISLQRNPFHNDLILSVGGWNFSLWREGHLEAPILQSACGKAPYTCGYWSLSRPAVFYLCNKTGNLEVWDILEHTHEPLVRQNITTACITGVMPCIVSSKQHLLAISDDIGTLHILEISWVLRNATASEASVLKKYLDREVERINYFEVRKPMWLEVKQASEQAKIDKRKQLVAARMQAADENNEEYLEEQQQYYENYLELERKLLKEIGVDVPGEEDDLFAF